MSAKKDLMLNESSLERQLAHEIDQSMASSASYHPILGILFAVFVAILVVFLTRPSERLPSFFRVLWLIVFALNLIAMSVPGRLDRVLATDMHVKPWTSLFEAAPWGFALWAGIIALEVLLVGYVALVGIPVDIFQGLTPYWIMGNLLQSVWCITYRPRFKSQLWIPALILAIAMVVFAKAHQEITFHLATSSFTNPTTKIVLYLVRIPFAMHGTWLAVAALLNLNSYVTIAGATKGNQLAVACCSAYFITAVGLFGATGRSDPVISITASWALESICSRSTEKMRMPRNFVGPEAYESLVITEGMLANLMKCVSLGVIVAPFFPASSFPSVP